MQPIESSSYAFTGFTAYSHHMLGISGTNVCTVLTQNNQWLMFVVNRIFIPTQITEIYFINIISCYLKICM
ncbi:hypothetical protein KQX54_019088 [Cotesia glomerata]|uniref:Uncharacterized protein n=1 Tax=Cotesia glomerata TaxID=32391 RepID=A0AAV7IGC2_COTGL|nr:hypothetical protein KQX54_019088 [Cotesia glomerata]